MAVGDVCKLELNYHVHQKRCMAVFYARVVTSPGAGSENVGLINAFQADVLIPIVAATSHELYIDGIFAHKVTGAHEPKWEAYANNVNGDITGDALPTNTPLRFTRTANTGSGPKKSGFNLSGISEASTVGSQVSAAWVAGPGADLLAALIGPWNTASGPVGVYQPVVRWHVWDRTTDPENPVPVSEHFDTVNTAVVNPIFVTLRRRQTTHSGTLLAIGHGG